MRREPGRGGGGGGGGSARSSGRWSRGTPQVEGCEARSYRVGDTPQEHAHQRVGGPEHLHFLLHEMLLLGFGGKAEPRAGASSCRGCGGGRDGGGRHSLPRTRASGSGSRPRLPSPTRKRCSPAPPSRDRRLGGSPAGARAGGAGQGRRRCGSARPGRRWVVTWRGCSAGAGCLGPPWRCGGRRSFPFRLCPCALRRRFLCETGSPLPCAGWLQICYPPVSSSYQGCVARRCGLILHEAGVAKEMDMANLNVYFKVVLCI